MGQLDTKNLSQLNKIYKIHKNTLIPSEFFLKKGRAKKPKIK